MFKFGFCHNLLIQYNFFQYNFHNEQRIIVIRFAFKLQRIRYTKAYVSDSEAVRQHEGQRLVECSVLKI